MKTREQIDSEHKAKQLEIRTSYHEKHEITHEEYHSQLNAENERYKGVLIAEGYPPAPASLPWQAEWAKADTVDKKLSVLARKQGLEG